MSHLHVDLCCGLGGWMEPFQDSDNWVSVGLDVRRGVGPTVVGDVRNLPISCHPVLVTASPPCWEYTSARNRTSPPAIRNPNHELWNNCVAAIVYLDPDWNILENVAQAQYWMGPSRKNVGPYHFWGHFPPFDVGSVPRKTTVSDTGSCKVRNSDEAAKIPYQISDALRRSVELYL